MTSLLWLNTQMKVLAETTTTTTTTVLNARFSVSRRWRSSWWKCQLVCLSSRSSSSRSLTFQLQVVVLLDIEIFKVFTQDKVRCSALFRRSLTFQFPMALMILSQNRIQRRLEDLVEVFNAFSHY